MDLEAIKEWNLHHNLWTVESEEEDGVKYNVQLSGIVKLKVITFLGIATL